MANNFNSLKNKKMIIQFAGYKGVNLDGFNIKQLKNLKQILDIALATPKYQRIDKDFTSLSLLSLDEIKAKTKEFYEKYFNLHTINHIPSENVENITTSIPITATPEEAFRIINSNIVEISPFDLNIVLTNGHAMSGLIQKQVPLIEGLLDNENRKMCFSHIELGNQVNSLSVGTLVHEIAHAEQEQNLGYAQDYLNREIISIFLEKVVALEADSSRSILELSERMRFSDLLNRYINLYNNYYVLSEEQVMDDLMYIKSILYAEKLFDLYINEGKQKNRDKYFMDIQDVFDGKKTVEEFYNSRFITTAKCLDLGMLKRHL